MEQPLSWFSGPLGSSWDTQESSERGPTERELGLLRRQLNKEMRSLLSQPASFELPGYSALREPHRTLDFLAEHHLFPALQNVVNRAAKKLSGARRRDGGPLFPSEWETARESGSKMATPADGEELYESPPSTASSPRTERRRNKCQGRGEAQGGGAPVPSPQVAARFRLEVTATEEPRVSASLPRHEGLGPDPRVRNLPLPSRSPCAPAGGPSPGRARALGGGGGALPTGPRRPPGPGPAGLAPPLVLEPLLRALTPRLCAQGPRSVSGPAGAGRDLVQTGAWGLGARSAVQRVLSPPLLASTAVTGRGASPCGYQALVGTT